MTSYELEVRNSDLGEVALAELSGELDLTNAAEFARRLEELSADSTALVLDLNGIQFLDSAALHVLFSLARRLELESKRLAIVLDPNARIAKTMSIVSFEDVSTVRASLDEVLDELSV